ncbi:MAG TPA: DUF1697 domain-containing protein [Vicinamibacterales bacterium]|nr:DUF1697 domain-containing protein [Vicinamibacterales bacterium]
MAESFVAFLRAINLAGKNTVAMADLRKMIESAGHRNARTLLNSGNVVFECAGKRECSAMERAFETASQKAFGFVPDFFVRTADELKAVVAGNPFPKEAKSDPGRLIVVFLKDAPGAPRVKTLQDSIPGREVIRMKPAGSRHLYIYYPDGQGRSKLTMTMIEKHLGSRGTARNWNTILKLHSSRSGQ